MDNLSNAQQEILAIKIVVQNMIALMSDQDQETLLKLTDSITSRLSDSEDDLAKHLVEVREKAMSMVKLGIGGDL